MSLSEGAFHFTSMCVTAVMAGHFIQHSDTFHAEQELHDKPHLLGYVFGIALVSQMLYFTLAFAYDLANCGFSTPGSVYLFVRNTMFSVVCFPIAAVFVVLHLLAYTSNTNEQTTDLNELSQMIAAYREWILFVILLTEVVAVHHTPNYWKLDVALIMAVGVFLALMFKVTHPALTVVEILISCLPWTGAIFVFYVVQRMLTLSFFEEDVDDDTTFINVASLRKEADTRMESQQQEHEGDDNDQEDEEDKEVSFKIDDQSNNNNENPVKTLFSDDDEDEVEPSASTSTFLSPGKRKRRVIIIEKTVLQSTHNTPRHSAPASAHTSAIFSDDDEQREEDEDHPGDTTAEFEEIKKNIPKDLQFGAPGPKSPAQPVRSRLRNKKPKSYKI